MGWEQDLCLLPETESQMFTPALDTSADLAIALLIHYSFDLTGYSASELVDLWQKQYPGNWLHLAVIEALYQGRYKAISVQQILTCWQRRGQAIFHFNMEFERLICSKFPQSLTSPPALPPDPMGTRGHLDTGREDKGTTGQGGQINSTYPAGSPSGSHSPRSGNQRQSPTAGDPPTVLAPPAAPQFLPEGNPPQNCSLSHRPGGVYKTQNSKLEVSSSSSSSPSHPTPHSPPLNQKDDVLPVASNNPPIGQFTPETSAGSELFTSKLKAISNEKRLPSGKLLPRSLRSSVSEEIANDNSYW
mgnify:CR=1 FL=1